MSLWGGLLSNAKGRGGHSSNGKVKIGFLSSLECSCLSRTTVNVLPWRRLVRQHYMVSRGLFGGMVSFKVFLKKL